MKRLLKMLCLVICASIVSISCKPPIVEAAPEKKSRTITFDADGGNPAKQEQKVYESEYILEQLPNNPSRNGYFFAGWWEQTGGGGSQIIQYTKIETDCTVYARWSLAEPAIVSFDSNGGTVLGSQDRKRVV